MENPPIKFSDIQASTTEFFRLHWPQTEQWGQEPQWNNPWRLRGSLPNGDKQGVYVLLDFNDDVIYIGVGASFGSGIYEGAGLGSRINHYIRLAEGQNGVRVEDRQYQAIEKWEELGLKSLRTLGFPIESAYLAYALEAHLLSRHAPPHNKVRASRTNN